MRNTIMKVMLTTCMLIISSPAYVHADTTSYLYDSLGRVVKVTYQNGTVITYTYDAAGNRTQVVKKPGV